MYHALHRQHHLVVCLRGPGRAPKLASSLDQHPRTHTVVVPRSKPREHRRRIRILPVRSQRRNQQRQARIATIKCKKRYHQVHTLALRVKLRERHHRTRIVPVLARSRHRRRPHQEVLSTPTEPRLRKQHHPVPTVLARAVRRRQLHQIHSLVTNVKPRSRRHRTHTALARLRRRRRNQQQALTACQRQHHQVLTLLASAKRRAPHRRIRTAVGRATCRNPQRRRVHTPPANAKRLHRPTHTAVASARHPRRLTRIMEANVSLNPRLRLSARCRRTPMPAARGKRTAPSRLTRTRAASTATRFLPREALRRRGAVVRSKRTSGAARPAMRRLERPLQPCIEATTAVRIVVTVATAAPTWLSSSRRWVVIRTARCAVAVVEEGELLQLQGGEGPALARAHGRPSALVGVATAVVVAGL